MKITLKIVFLTLLILSLFNSELLMGGVNLTNYRNSGQLTESQSKLKLKYSIPSYAPTSEQKYFNLQSILFLDSDESVSKKSPWLAFGLSLLYPGLGQLYNGEYGKALLMGGLGTAGLGLAMLAAMSTDFDSESNPDYIGVMLYSGVAIYGGVYLWSMIDAPISASNINERSRKFGIRILSTEDEKFDVRLRNGKKINNPSLNFSFNF